MNIFEKKYRYSFHPHCPHRKAFSEANVHYSNHKATLKQVIHHFREADDTENSQEALEPKITPEPQTEAREAVMVSPSTSRFEDEVRAKEEGVVHQQRSRGTPPRFLPVARHEERFLTGKATSFDRSEDCQT